MKFFHKLCFVFMLATSQGYSNNFFLKWKPNSEEIDGYPEKDNKLTNSNDSPIKSKIPENVPFIVQLYESLAKNHKTLPYGAEFVRSFSSQGNVTMGKSSVMKFKIKIPTNERILFSMLHLCVIEDNVKHPLTLRIVDASSRYIASSKGHTNKNRQCFEVPVTKIVKWKRQRNPDDIRLNLFVTKSSDNVLTAFNKYSRSDKQSVQPEIVVFSATNSETPKPFKFDIQPNENFASKREPQPIMLGVADYAKRSEKRYYISNSATTVGCYRRSLIVNFEGLGYSNIIAPTVFDAKQCIGKCQYPLGKSMNPTQHSSIQQLLHSLHGNRVAISACCAPRKLVPLLTIIKDTYSGRIAIRSLDDMIVEECGCI